MLTRNIITSVPGLERAISYAWHPIGSLFFKMSYRKAYRNGQINLHVGASAVRLEGWLNTDIRPPSLYLNVSRHLPIQDNSVSYIFSEQLIEYLPMDATLSFVKECYRILLPNGILRITNEDMGAFTRAYLNDPESIRLLN